VVVKAKEGWKDGEATALSPIQCHSAVGQEDGSDSNSIRTHDV